MGHFKPKIGEILFCNFCHSEIHIQHYGRLAINRVHISVLIIPTKLHGPAWHTAYWLDEAALMG